MEEVAAAAASGAWTPWATWAALEGETWHQLAGWEVRDRIHSSWVEVCSGMLFCKWGDEPLCCHYLKSKVTFFSCWDMYRSGMGGMDRDFGHSDMSMNRGFGDSFGGMGEWYFRHRISCKFRGCFLSSVVVCLLADWFCVWRCYVIVLWFNLIRTNSLYLFRWWLWRRHGQWWHGAHGDWIRYIKYSVHYFSKAVKHQFIPEVHITFGGTALADSWGLFYYWWLLNVCILNCFLRAIIQPIMQKSEFVDHGA